MYPNDAILIHVFFVYVIHFLPKHVLSYLNWNLPSLNKHYRWSYRLNGSTLTYNTSAIYVSKLSNKVLILQFVYRLYVLHLTYMVKWFVRNSFILLCCFICNLIKKPNLMITVLLALRMSLKILKNGEILGFLFVVF